MLGLRAGTCWDMLGRMPEAIGLQIGSGARGAEDSAGQEPERSRTPPTKGGLLARNLACLLALLACILACFLACIL